MSVHDNGMNIAAGFCDSNIPSVPCLAHIIQNVVQKGLLKSETPVTRLLSLAKKLVGQLIAHPKQLTV